MTERPAIEGGMPTPNDFQLDGEKLTHTASNITFWLDENGELMWQAGQELPELSPEERRTLLDAARTILIQERTPCF